jgi:acyl dehydratase
MSDPLNSAAVGETVAEGTYGPLTREDLRRYAQASGDLNPLHFDPEFAKQAGFDDVIVQGMLGMALLGRLITEQFGPERLRAFRARFRQVIHIGEPIHCRARLEARNEESEILALEALSPSGALLIEGTVTLKSWGR